jgi:hypothetical protein
MRSNLSGCYDHPLQYPIERDLIVAKSGGSMDWESLIGPTVIAVGVSGGISIVALIVVSIRRARVIEFAFDRDPERKIAFDKDMAERKFKFDLELHDRQRRVELAETVLAEFRQITKIVSAIRSPMAFANEGAERPRGQKETKEQSHEKDTYFVPYARVAKHGGSIVRFESQRSRASAVLGEGIDEAFQAIFDVLIRVQVSSSRLVAMVGEGPELRGANEGLWKSCEQELWENLVEEDPLSIKVQRAMTAVEDVCRPILRGALQK